MARQILNGARIFDGQHLLDGYSLILSDGVIEALLPSDQVEAPTIETDGIIAPGFVDLQVNGGGGLMLDGTTDLAALRHICATHRANGSAAILPTLITATAETTAQIIAAGIAATQEGIPGFLGLHLEGPHLDPRRKGAHDPALIRPMDDDDLSRLIEAARSLPALMVTLAPVSASPQQIAALTGAGVIVSLGHTDCDFETAQAAFAAGARCATHLYNAMSQLGHRSPGLVGAVLSGHAHVGLIADNIHVHPGAMKAALNARPDGIFLVSDCMAFAGSEMDRMTLNDRVILRQNGRLTLGDGTLAGADLRLDRAVANTVSLGIVPERALAMATSVPADLIGCGDHFGRIAAGRAADLILLDDSFLLTGVWAEADWRSPIEK
jgi:N-acetylglucosamine-6-phosphate deacetylase